MRRNRTAPEVLPAMSRELVRQAPLPQRPEPEHQGRGIVEHWLGDLRRRAHLAIEEKTYQRTLPVIKAATERARLISQYRTAMADMIVAEAERQVRMLELE